MTPEINRILDELEVRRERKTARDGMLRQFDGFREEWNAYQDEYASNFSMD